MWTTGWGVMGVMSLRGDNTAYEVRVAGLMAKGVLRDLDEVEVAEEEVRTVLSGHFADQAALYGFLHRLRDLGLDVVDVRQVAGPMTEDAPGGT